MGKGKLLKFNELLSFEHVVQAPFNVVEHNDFQLKGKWGKEFFKNDNPLILELGCGKGEYTVALAAKNPDVNYMGVDIKGARLWRGAKLAKEQGLTNVGFLRANIEQITQFYGASEVAEIWLTFPDPQMEKTRKRLTSTTFLNKYREFLKPGGIVHLKTDSNFQYNYTRELVKLNRFEILAETDDVYEWEHLDDTLRIRTFYEKQWLDRGIKIKYIAFRLDTGEFLEPDVEIEKDEYRSFGRSARE
ncbi:tRNA (guanosine(46)-N7)-methyltransferase TrmB [Maribellus sp. CM-23]|uniref:tRNA (guanosine(46)-N7)-methyltransferase TrmB n=1 Tax=Maribellus sp. CM-23 TaxID=2781026 RepID=UPI001F49094B|nr:tRNA (guanosine(46)-N7)-methyltransferase TrmB [Maribellus sp. CM-23]MCE4563944.1 tRNA (guanosine(46)-N7)-methyltransferase TrmB [Maribellus sp. CM-23]